LPHKLRDNEDIKMRTTIKAVLAVTLVLASLNIAQACIHEGNQGWKGDVTCDYSGWGSVNHTEYEPSLSLGSYTQMENEIISEVGSIERYKRHYH